MIDLIAGQVQLVFSSAPTAVPQVKAGKIRGIAVTTIRRSTALPELPTIAESGLPGYEADNGYGIVTTAGTQRPIINYLNTEIVRALQLPEVKELLFKQGLEVRTSTRRIWRVYQVGIRQVEESHQGRGHLGELMTAMPWWRPAEHVAITIVLEAQLARIGARRGEFLSREAGAFDRSVSAGRRLGIGGAARGSEADRNLEPSRRRRQSRRRRRQHGHRYSGEIRA